MPGGLTIKTSPKNYSAEKAELFGLSVPQFSPIRPINRLDELLTSPFKDKPFYQGDSIGCVPCTLSFINCWNSWKEMGTDPFTSWPFLLALAKQHNGGTVPQESFDNLRKTGQPRDVLLPQEKYADNGASFMLSPDLITHQMYLEAQKYKISNNVWLTDLSKENIYRWLLKGPLFAGALIEPAEWNTQDIVKWSGGSVGHAFALIGVGGNENTGEKWWNVLSWDEKEGLDIKKLDIDYPFKLVSSIVDLPDNIDKTKIRRGFVWQDFLRKLLGF